MRTFTMRAYSHGERTGQAIQTLTDELCFLSFLILRQPHFRPPSTLPRQHVYLSFTRLYPCRFRDPICTMYEPPVLAAGTFALACEDVEVDPSEFNSGGSVDAGAIPSTSTSRPTTTTTWLQAFDVSQREVDGE